MELDAGGRRLRAALAAVLVRDNAPELRLMHDWLDWDVQLTAYAARDWRANFFLTGIAHTRSSAGRRGNRRRGERDSGRRGRRSRSSGATISGWTTSTSPFS